MICDRCGLNHTRCHSPFEIGDSVWWDIQGACPDLPPVRGLFVGLSDYFEEKGQPAGAMLKIIPDSVLKEHVEAMPSVFSNEQITVPCANCTPIERWPSVVVGEPT
jgi:hypothetical protein